MSVKHLPGRHNQDDHGRHLLGSGKWKLDLAEAVEHVEGNGPVDDETAAAVIEVYTIKHGGLSTTDISVTGRVQLDGTPSLLVKGKVRDTSGAEVGKFSRFLMTEGDKPIASHAIFEIDKNLQGQGFAHAFNGQAFDWYRESGVAEVRLTANIDVGGYAWARAGYDWADAEGVAAIRTRLSNVARRGAAKIPADRREEQRRLAAEMLDRLKQSKFGSEDFPTPFELSQLGRWEGAGRDDWWAGKVIMMGSKWNAATAP